MSITYGEADNEIVVGPVAISTTGTLVDEVDWRYFVTAINIVLTTSIIREITTTAHVYDPRRIQSNIIFFKRLFLQTYVVLPQIVGIYGVECTEYAYIRHERIVYK